MLGRIYGFLCSCYTEPPKTFDFEYVDKDRQYHIEKGYTPQSFCEKYVGDLLEKTVSIIHAASEADMHTVLHRNMENNIK